MEVLLPNANPALTNIVDPDKISKEEKALNKVRILVAIPNEGHAPVEAYANRLVNFMHLGKLEERSTFFDLIKKYAPESLTIIETEYWKDKKPDYQRFLDGKVFEFYNFTAGRILTPLAREKCVENALKGNFDYIFFIDDDMICPDDLFERLYRHNVDLVAPLAFTRNPPHQPVCYSNDDYWDPVHQKQLFVNDTIQNYPKNQLFRCDAVGFGAALIKVEIIRKMQAPYFMSTTGTGEDILFCYKAQKAGAKIYMDSSTKLGHLSHPTQITEEYAVNYQEAHKLDVERKNKEYDKYIDDKNTVVLGN